MASLANRLVACWKLLGPGLLMAGAAIGVSHLVQSTRAGADFGWQLLGVVLLINLLKYPFFEYGHRFTAATGRNLLQGYDAMGRPFLWLFFALNAVSAVISVAAVTVVTAALADNLTGTGGRLLGWSAALFGFTALVLAFGRYHWLDRIIKVMMLVLLLATITAFAAALARGPSPQPGVAVPDLGEGAQLLASLGFIIALMGWMPAPIEISVWQGLWMQAKERDRGQRVSLAEALVDFRVGYGLCVVLAVLFLGLGALVMHGTGEAFSDSGAVFASQVVGLYTRSLGQWAWPVISTAALFTMYSTTLTLVDAFPRALAECTRIVSPERAAGFGWHRLHLFWIALVCAGALAVIFIGLREGFTVLIDLVTTIAFVAGTIFALLNWLVVRSAQMPVAFRPGRGLNALSVVGIGVFAAISVVFLLLLAGVF
jgi:Mn2+/Fe2+ NRAMP family transporter